MPKEGWRLTTSHQPREEPRTRPRLSTPALWVLREAVQQAEGAEWELGEQEMAGLGSGQVAYWEPPTGPGLGPWFEEGSESHVWPCPGPLQPRPQLPPSPA